MTLLTDFRLLGRSGLRISPLCLGTMTFGASWGSDEADSQRIFDAYVDAGGNFVDTANYYGRGVSEGMLGKFLVKKREQTILATKYSLGLKPGDPNDCGNHRRSMVRSVEASLKRLKTDYIDLFYLHMWDNTTPIDEIMRAFDDLVSAGKIVYIGISDTPAWQVSRMQMLADLRGWAPFIALQIEYSLIQRTVERDLIPMAAELGLGVTPWSPIAGGLLSGKYARGSKGDEGARGVAMVKAGKFNERVFNIADAVRVVATRHERSSAEIALAWTLTNPAVAAPILGARTMEHLQQNLKALEIEFTPEDLQALDRASAIDLGFPHDFLEQPIALEGLSGGASIRPRTKII